MNALASTALAQDLLTSLRDRTDDLVATLKALVEIESPSTVAATQRGVQRVLGDELGALGFEVRVLPGTTSGGTLYARPRDRRPGPVQLLLGHSDTVWPEGKLATMPAVVRDGALRGPGVYDMKAGLVQIVFALRALRDLGVEPAVTPVVLVNSDEEIGSAESAVWIRRLARISDRALVLEPALGRSGLIKTARKGVGKFTVRVRGKAAHAGLDPGAGASAIIELSHVVQQLHALNDLDRGVTVNVGMIEGGMRSNVVAPEASAVADVRVPTHDDARRIEAAIYGISAVTPGTVVEVEGGVGRPPMERTPRNRVLWARALEAADALGLDIDEGTAGGGSDGNITSQFTATLDGLGAVGDGAHAEHEYVEIAPLAERTALLALLIASPPLGTNTNGTPP